MCINGWCLRVSECVKVLVLCLCGCPCVCTFVYVFEVGFKESFWIKISKIKIYVKTQGLYELMCTTFKPPLPLGKFLLVLSICL